MDDFNHHQKKFTIFVGFPLLMKALLEKNILQGQEACIKCKIKLIETLLEKKDFEGFHQEFMESYLSQREYWINNGILFKNSYFGYLD